MTLYVTWKALRWTQQALLRWWSLWFQKSFVVETLDFVRLEDFHKVLDSTPLAPPY